MASLQDSGAGSGRGLLGSRAYTAGGSTYGSVSAFLAKTANTITYIINGIFYSKTATDNIAATTTSLTDISTAITITAASNTSISIPDQYNLLVVLGLDASGNFRYYQGKLFKSETANTWNGTTNVSTTKYRGYDTTVKADGTQKQTAGGALEDFNSRYLPQIPDGICPVAVCKIANTSGGALSALVTGGPSLNTYGTFKDVSVLQADFNF